MKMDFKELIIVLCLLLTFAQATFKEKSNNDTLNIWPTEIDADEEIQKRSKQPGWSSWSEWSTCSRTCDGGVAFQLRRCHGSQGCKGDAVRYKICNMQPCPEQQDFRAHQCLVFDDVPYDGALFKWTPHYDDSEPCALTCRGRPAHLPDDAAETGAESFGGADDEPSVIVQLSNRVHDGTRCRPGSLDMCIQGKCQRVGCDLKIGSTKKIDVCGVCSGDGTSCSQPLYQWEISPMSLCSVTCGGGNEVEESLCNASSRPEPTVVQCNTHLCPPKWIADEWGPCSKSCGGGVRERIVVCAEESNGVKNKVPDEACRGVIPKTTEACSIQECPKWTAGEWSGCSVSCGAGIQVRSVECTDHHGSSNTQCEPSSKPVAAQPCTTGISCNVEHAISEDEEKLNDDPRYSSSYVDDTPPFYTQPLKHHSMASDDAMPRAERLVDQRVPSEATFIKDLEWSPCSVTCGEGIRRRTYRCKIFLEFSRTVATLNDSLCHGPKPTDEIDHCSMDACSMSMTGFLSDDKSVHDGVKVGSADRGKTYSWREDGYTSCSSSCLGGVEELIIKCVRDDTGKPSSPYFCSPETKPENRIRTCNDIPCPPRWNYSDYSPCTKSCGIGIKTREVHCIHEVTRGGENTMVVPNNMCPQPPPPDRQYCNVLDCPVRWEVSEWSKCSKSCGSGVKERRVECKQIMAQEHKVERPSTMCGNAKPPDKKPCNTKPCAPEDQRPPIESSNTTFIQHDPKKNKLSLKIGGAATIFYGTQIKIKCPVKRYNRTKIRWSKDHNNLTKTKRIKISKKGALRILDVTFRDAGIYTCHAGLSTADLRITVKPKPGDSANSEEQELGKYSNSRPDTQGSTYISPTDDRSHERPNVRNKQRDRNKNKNRQLVDSNGNAESSVMDDGEEFQSHSKMAVSDSAALNPTATSSGSRTVPMPHFQHLLASLQTFSNSRGHQLLMEHANRYSVGGNEDHAVKIIDNLDGYVDDELMIPADDAVAHTNQRRHEHIHFEWMITPWSECSQTCGTSGYKLRSAHCMVRLENSTQNVDNNMCEEAGLQIPETVEKCGNIECPRWIATEWATCAESKCFAWHTALQKRDVFCKFGNDSNSELCDEAEKSVTKQECYNEHCKGIWRVEPWSECNAACDSQGIKYRTLQCVWYGTKKMAGNACKDQPRPAVMKACRGPPCVSNLSECNDVSRYCKKVKTMGLCRLHRYQQQCCKTCRFNIYN